MTDNDQRVLIELDARGRASLARLGRPEHRRYLARVEADGTIILTPATVVPVRGASGEPDTWHGRGHHE
jgi:hypothetical protein